MSGTPTEPSTSNAPSSAPGTRPATARAFKINPADTVATAIDDVPAGGRVAIFGAGSGEEVVATGPIARGHKIALTNCAAGAPVVKFGVRIGLATTRITPGDWVHLHNCASAHDARSGSLDLHTGAPTDQTDAYV